MAAFGLHCCIGGITLSERDIAEDIAWHGAVVKRGVRRMGVSRYVGMCGAGERNGVRQTRGRVRSRQGGSERRYFELL